MGNDGSVRVADIFARPIGQIDPDPDNCRDIDSPIAPTEARKMVKASADPVATLHKTREVTRAAGRTRIKPRDVAEVIRPRTEPVSLCSLAVAAVQAWKTGTPDQFTMAMTALETHLGPLARAA
jgi:hypothetical protein